MKTKLIILFVVTIFTIMALAIGPSDVIPVTYSENDGTGDKFFYTPSGKNIASITFRNHDTTDTVNIIPSSYTALVDPDWAEQTVTAPAAVVQRGATGSDPTTGIMTLTAVAPIDSRAKYWRKITPVTFTGIVYAGATSVTITASANYFKAGDYIYVTAGDSVAAGTGTSVYTACIGKRLLVTAVNAATTTIVATTASTVTNGHTVTGTTGSLNLEVPCTDSAYKYCYLEDQSTKATYPLKYPNIVVADHVAYFISDVAITASTDFRCLWPAPILLGPATAGIEHSYVKDFPIDLEDDDGLYIDASGAAIISGYVTLE